VRLTISVRATNITTSYWVCPPSRGRLNNTVRLQKRLTRFLRQRKQTKRHDRTSAMRTAIIGSLVVIGLCSGCATTNTKSTWSCNPQRAMFCDTGSVRKGTASFDAQDILPVRVSAQGKDVLLAVTLTNPTEHNTGYLGIKGARLRVGNSLWLLKGMGILSADKFKSSERTGTFDLSPITPGFIDYCLMEDSTTKIFLLLFANPTPQLKVSNNQLVTVEGFLNSPSLEMSVD